MDITEVKVILKEGPDKKLKAYATLTLDNCFVVRNVKVIKGNKGLFVAMPSRKMRETCPRCNYKNVIRSKFCNQCGASLPAPGVRDVSQEMKQSEHRDIAHPITLECREYIQKKILAAYEEELKESPSFQRQSPPQESPALRETKATDADFNRGEKVPMEESGDIKL